MGCLINKVVLVTGAGGDIGRHISLLFAKKQAKLVLVDIDEESLTETKCLCEKEEESIEILAIIADLTVKNELESVIEKTLERFKKMDVLVNNAGIGVLQRVSETSWDDYDKTMSINLKVPFFLIKGFMPELIKTKGSVINISSLGGIIPSQLVAVYCLSKAGLSHLTRVVAQEYARHKVRVNAICPGAVDTKMAGTEENPNFVRLQAKPCQPICGLINPESIAAWVIWLASDESGPITGQNIVVDGGGEVTRIPLDYKRPQKL